MTFVEKYEEFKCTLLEMSFGQGDAIKKIEDQIPQIVLHILKILITKDDIEINLHHWDSEITNFLTIISISSNVKQKKGIRVSTSINNYKSYYTDTPLFDSLAESLEKNYTILKWSKTKVLAILKGFFEDEIFPRIEKKNFRGFLKQNFAERFYKLRPEVLL